MSFLRQIFFMIAFAAVPAFANAATLDLTLDSLVQVGNPNSLLVFNGTLTNTSGIELFLNGANSNIDYSELLVDFTPFWSNAPFSLLDQEIYSGPLFSVGISNIALPGDYFGSFEIQGGMDSNASDILASGDFQVTVSEVPEPSSGILLGTILLPLSLAYFLRLGRCC
jgi:hypothetical protein